MQIVHKEIPAGIRFSLQKEGKELGRAFLYLLNNDLHKEPFGYVEDVYISDELQGQGLGTKIMQHLIDTAKERGCYKIILTSRYGKDKVHAFYEKLGFTDHGKSFRLDL